MVKTKKDDTLHRRGPSGQSTWSNRTSVLTMGNAVAYWGNLSYTFRKFAVKSCARCHLGISSNELVMKARDWVYHLNCFTCVSCNKVLTTGEHFGMKDDLIFCKVRSMIFYFFYTAF